MKNIRDAPVFWNRLFYDKSTAVLYNHRGEFLLFYKSLRVLISTQKKCVILNSTQAISGKNLKLDYSPPTCHQ